MSFFSSFFTSFATTFSLLGGTPFSFFSWYLKLDCECERLSHSHLRVGNLVVGVLGHEEGVATSSLLLLLGDQHSINFVSEGLRVHWCRETLQSSLMSLNLVGGDLVRAFRGVLHRLFPVSSQVQLTTYLWLILSWTESLDPTWWCRSSQPRRQPQALLRQSSAVETFRLCVLSLSLIATDWFSQFKKQSISFSSNSDLWLE